LFVRTFREKRIVYLGSYLELRGHRDFKTGGPSGTLLKGQGTPELISDYGAQRTSL
jgi:hypothetical protein